MFDIHRFTVGSETITVRVLNTAWGSKLKEGLGSLPMPVKLLKPHLLADADGSIVITAFHHPYSWLQKEVSREIRNMIEKTSDLVFTDTSTSGRATPRPNLLGSITNILRLGHFKKMMRRTE